MRRCLDHAFKTVLPGVFVGLLLLGDVGELGQTPP